jgi:hypothetical protein
LKLEIVAKVLAETYELFTDGKQMAGLHHLSFALDDWLHDGDREAIELLFSISDIEKLGLGGCKAILTDTRPAAADFPCREEFLNKVKQAHPTKKLS